MKLFSKPIIYVTVADAAVAANVSETTIYKAINRGELPSRTVKVIDRTDLLEFIWQRKKDE